MTHAVILAMEPELTFKRAEKQQIAWGVLRGEYDLIPGLTKPTLIQAETRVQERAVEAETWQELRSPIQVELMEAWTSNGEGEAQTEFHKEISKTHNELRNICTHIKKGCFSTDQ